MTQCVRSQPRGRRGAHRESGCGAHREVVAWSSRAATQPGDATAEAPRRRLARRAAAQCHRAGSVWGGVMEMTLWTTVSTPSGWSCSSSIKTLSITRIRIWRCRAATGRPGGLRERRLRLQLTQGGQEAQHGRQVQDRAAAAGQLAKVEVQDDLRLEKHN